MNSLNADLAVNGTGSKASGSKGQKVHGSIQGTHYDPDSAAANRGAKRRPVPVTQNKGQ